VAGGTASGVEAAKAVLGCRTRDILTGSEGGPRFLRAESQTDFVTDSRMGTEEDEKEV
jgi:hypothetical protein